ncbi:hypothetical protein POV27_06155 [Aureisphaera galaxeae]|uniref:hypothetical protein n=1 Tax=Aureisphaera galaxeae TaxID=1538023 RepID=UPI002350F06D|nr:hypothetical protein [Aureisphaera galaxeae]MDC8003626.1 hypothetical protein [Aureisphaera galaxeae]
MSFGAGHIMDMIQTLKNNKRTRKTRFDKDAEKLGETYGEFVDHKKMTPEEFAAFQVRFKEQKRKERKRFLWVFGSIMLVIIIVLYYLLFVYNW